MAEINEYRQNLQPLIIAEAERQFRQRGIKSVTMEDISKTLHISKRTIYELYTNKEEILIEVLLKTQERMKAYLEDYSQRCDSVMDLLIEIFRIQFESSATTHPSFFHDLAKYPKAEKTLKEYKEAQRNSSYEFFAKGVSEGYFLSSVDFSVFMRIITAIQEVIRNDAELKKLTYHELLNNYICILTRGICTQKGLVKFDQFLEQQKHK